MSNYSKRKLHFDNTYLIDENNDLVAAKPEVNKIVFSPENYNIRDEMWRDIANLQCTLLRNGQVARIRQEENYIIVEYVHDNNVEWFGGTCLEFITEDELEMIRSMRSEDCETLNILLSGENEEDKESEETSK